MLILGREGTETASLLSGLQKDSFLTFQALDVVTQAKPLFKMSA